MKEAKEESLTAAKEMAATHQLVDEVDVLGDGLQKKIDEYSETISRLNKEPEEAKEESLTMSMELAELNYLSRASEMEELVRLSNEL